MQREDPNQRRDREETRIGGNPQGTTSAQNERTRSTSERVSELLSLVSAISGIILIPVSTIMSLVVDKEVISERNENPERDENS